MHNYMWVTWVQIVYLSDLETTNQNVKAREADTTDDKTQPASSDVASILWKESIQEEKKLI